MKHCWLLRLTAATLSTALLPGCSVYSPRIQIQPRVELRDSFQDSGIEASDRWWEDFDDPGLTRVMEATLGDSRSLRMAWARLDQMQALARAAGAGRYATADLTTNGQRQRLGGDRSATGNSLLASMTVGYQVDLWKKIGNRRRAALLDQQASRQDVEATAFALTGAAGELWYGIAAEQATLRLLDEQLGVGQDLLDLVQLRFANGLASAVEVYQQRLQVEVTRDQIPAATTRLSTRKHQMAVLLGREPRASVPLPAARLPELPPLPPTGVPLDVLRSRPDVRAAEMRLLAADHRLAAAISDRYPSLSISATAGGQAERLANILEQWFVNLTGNLLAPVLDGGRRAAEADRDRAMVEERLYAWESALLASCGEVEDALVVERGLEETGRGLDSQLELAASSLDRSRALYVNGLTDYLTVLTSLQALQNLQRRAIRTRQALLSNRIKLYIALGGSWSHTLENPSDSPKEHS